MHDNYRRPITLEGVAERVGISPRQLQRIFREKAEMTFSQYVESYRLQCIREELVRSSKTLEQIALENGFVTSNYLHYVFKKAYGVTPMQYLRYKECII
ncbi:helix-turn-helix transcriptional regulator [Paenibacillus larvae]|uniref:helix-turn-helix transcriptional regulator n=1 Tax=Paenibacillus larvae TaxID=1464 RepID=UPI00215041EC|nr:helix-turn-helix transcriptional regulator [Paenibacillus larvae]